MTRPSWDEYFLHIAFEVSQRSTCDRAHVGAVIVVDKQIMTTGYNGSPSGMLHCDDAGHDMQDGHCIRTIHAELNAVAQAAKHGVKIMNSTLYVTHFPCHNCQKVIINAGIARVVYCKTYGVAIEKGIIFSSGITVENIFVPGSELLR
jgi:dCMP deaminase